MKALNIKSPPGRTAETNTTCKVSPIKNKFKKLMHTSECIIISSKRNHQNHKHNFLNCVKQINSLNSLPFYYIAVDKNKRI